MKKHIVAVALFSATSLWSQTPSNLVQESITAKKTIENQSLFQRVTFQNIGPTIMSGRVVDLNVNPENPIEFYVAYASGGLWYTNNNGTSFTPVLDSAPTQNCGAITVNWKSGEIWLGTGEVNSSRSSYSGIGIFKSSDKGKTWQNMGLHESHHISKIIVNPNNSNEIIVGVVGHLYTKNNERGVYKTIDGGKNWVQTLFVNDETGVIDIAADPINANVLFASAWQKDRKAHNFKGNGLGSGMYKSTDGGSRWKLISTNESGFPNDEFVGRIGLTVFNETTLYAVVDNQKMRPSAKSEKSKDANSALFETEVIGAEVYKSADGGTTWKKTHDSFIDDLYYTYGYYFGDITVDPKNENRIYLTGVPLLYSVDSGKTFESIDGDNVHADHHVVWINPKNPNHIVNGNDGGINITYDNGKNWLKCNSIPVGQFYAINVDEKEPYNVYGGLQDNGVWMGPNNFENNNSWQAEGENPYKFLSGGDGMQVQIDKRNPNIVFTGSQYGSYSRIDRAKDTRKSITPKSKKEEEPFRYNWQTPILLSTHNQDILYFGSNFLHRSMNQGETWEKISGDLTKGKKEGNVAFGTLTTISESFFQFGLLYTGSDDGLAYVSKDGGNSWTNISKSLPQNLWVSRILASMHKKERVYITLNGYRNDDFACYVYVSEDYGQTWKSISNNLPSSPVNVLVEDPKNKAILYVGTDNGLYVSLDSGASWQDFSAGIPDVAVHDLVIQKKDNDLLVGTHGRSIYKVNINQVQQLTEALVAKNVHLFETSAIKKSDRWGDSWSSFGTPYESKMKFWCYSGANQTLKWTIENQDKTVVFSKEIAASKGLNPLEYNLSLDASTAEKWNAKNKDLKVTKAKNGTYYLPVGKYKLLVQSGKDKAETDFEVKASK